MDPLYGYQAVNVEAQLQLDHVAAALEPPDDRDPQAAPRLRAGRVTASWAASNPTVLAYMRTLTATTIVLCVNNMSRFPQPVELDLSALARAACRTS